MLRTVVVNALAGPGAGKSTLSYGLIAKLKAEGHRAELVTEYAKDLTWRRDFVALANQFEVTREQDRRLRDLVGQVDFIVHDTALPFGTIYAKAPYDEPWHVRRCWELFDSYRNFNVFVTRKKAYQTAGRNQTEAEAVELDKRIRALFDGRIDIEVEGKSDAVDQVYDALMALA
jgi:hypothetical protein